MRETPLTEQSLKETEDCNREGYLVRRSETVRCARRLEESVPSGVRTQERSEQGTWGRMPGQAAGVGRAGQHRTRPASSYTAGRSVGAPGSETEGAQRGGG